MNPRCQFLIIAIVFIVTGIIWSKEFEGGAILLRGTDFNGGASHLFGDAQYNKLGVNYVYAAPTGDSSRMQATFERARIPGSPLFLHIEGMDDDYASTCPIEIRLNEHVIFKGANGFPDGVWGVRLFRIEPGLLKAGLNSITISNIAPTGEAGRPPWFMLSRCAIGGEDMSSAFIVGIQEDFRINLPDQKRPIPEPYKSPEDTGFAMRGTKGWLWLPEQYLAEIPIIAEYKMNFLMNCYGSMYDIEHYQWGDPRCNRWWEPLPEDKKRAYEQIVHKCTQHDIVFCFSMNPNLGSTRIFDYDNPQDLDDLWQHYDWMQRLGVQWFNISLDDISKGIDAAGQARAVNEIFRRLRKNDPHAQMIFTPTHYWGTGNDDPYLTTLGATLHPDVFIFWTGNEVVCKSIKTEDASSYKEAVKHRLFLWDNYPVNDATPTMHLGPVMNRDRDLHTVIYGYMSNPLHSQNEINRLPLITCADYAYNPRAYDPARSIGQAILHLADTKEQQIVLRDLVELYPGFLIADHPATNWNPVIVRFGQIINTPHQHFIARLYIDHVENVIKRLRSEFPRQFESAQHTLAADLEKVWKEYNHRYGK